MIILVCLNSFIFFQNTTEEKKIKTFDNPDFYLLHGQFLSLFLFLCLSISPQSIYFWLFLSVSPPPLSLCLWLSLYVSPYFTVPLSVSLSSVFVCLMHSLYLPCSFPVFVYLSLPLSLSFSLSASPTLSIFIALFLSLSRSPFSLYLSFSHSLNHWFSLTPSIWQPRFFLLWLTFVKSFDVCAASFYHFWHLWIRFSQSTIFTCYISVERT